MRTTTERQLREWWNDTHRAFMEILHLYDPLDMGSTVSAPDDEYFDEATRTIRAVLDLGDAFGPRESIASCWPGAGDEMLDELVAAWRSPPPGTS